MSSIKNLLLKKPLFSAIVFAGVIGLFVGGLSWKVMTSQHSRKPASAFKASKDFALSGKSNRSFDVSLTSDISKTFSETTEVKLTARIVHIRSGSREVHYKWILPEGVKVVDGDLEDSWANVPAGKALNVDISVSGFDPGENQHVVLQAWYVDQGARFGGASIFVTKPEETLEYQTVQKLIEQESE
ncbi:MAG: hypothetical protein AB7O96_10270 [Pseudobdellovibrionaceae bacterium]